MDNNKLMKTMTKKTRDLIDSVVITVIGLFILFFICWPFEVSGVSMEDTLKDKDRIVVSRILPTFSPYKHGDIAVCEVLVNGKAELIVKRVVGVPGDVVNLNGISVRLGEDEFFVVGDNESKSLDSRSFGAIKRKKFVGKVIARWLPISQFKSF